MEPTNGFKRAAYCFARVLEHEQIQSLRRRDLACEANISNARTRVIFRRKYTLVDVGRSGKYMVDNETGEIFGVKAYGKIHRGHRYGTLGTIAQWHWGEYQGIKKRSPAALEG